MMTAPMLIWLLLSWMMPQGLAPTPGGLKGYSAGGPVTYDASSKSQCTAEGCDGGGSTTMTWSHTTGAGSNRGMAVGCTVAGSSSTVEPNISTVTYNGVSLSQLVKRDANYDTYIWTLPNGTEPASGAHNVVVTLASGLGTVSQDYLTCVAITAAGVNQTSAWDVTDCTGAGSGTSATCTLSANSSNDLLAVFVCNGTSIGAAGSGITSRQSTNNGAGACNSLGGGTGAGGTTAVGWTVGSDTWQILAAAWKSN